MSLLRLAISISVSFIGCTSCAASRLPSSPSDPDVDKPRPGAPSAQAADEPATSFSNPVISGTSPDPSVCKVGDTYYVVTSSFEYFPGVPIHKSKDLVHWQHIGHVLDRESQLQLRTLPSSQGVFAPTLRWHNGKFYMITTNMSGGGSFYVTSEQPQGPWSEPIWIREDTFTMDPSLFFDDDGKVYYTRHGEQRHGAIFQAQIDLQTGKLDRVPQKIWSGTGGIWPEGPHLYKVAGTYYLMLSEGGTSYDHQVTLARSNSPWGPFEPAPNNPLLSHRQLPEHPIQATGHADLVQTNEGQWWMVFLGIRPSTHRHHHIGRETFLAPVEWNNDGWFSVNQGAPVALRMSTNNLPKLQPWALEPSKEEFTALPRSHWQYVRAKEEKNYSSTARPGYVRLTGSTTSLSDIGVPTAMVQPQRFLEVDVSAEIDIDAKPGQRGGLVVRGNEKNHYALLVEGTEQGRVVRLRTTIDGASQVTPGVELAPGPVTLRIVGALDRYTFFVTQGAAPASALGHAPTTAFAYEKTQSFTGAYVGLYAHQDAGTPPTVLDVEWFEQRAR
jgi:xylan 1,4-beta-xylosidase